MKKSIDILEQISDELHSHTIYYKFNENSPLPLKYKKGRVDASLWLNDLVLYYIQKEKSFLQEFKEEIQKQREKLQGIKNGDYKKGLEDELNTIEDKINDRINK